MKAKKETVKKAKASKTVRSTNLGKKAHNFLIGKRMRVKLGG